MVGVKGRIHHARRIPSDCSSLHRLEVRVRVMVRVRVRVRRHAVAVYRYG